MTGPSLSDKHCAILLCILFAVLLYLFLTVMMQAQEVTQNLPANVITSLLEKGNRFPSNEVIVLLWTTFFLDDDWTGFYGSHDSLCSYRCTFTRDRNMITGSHAVLFNLRDLKETPLPSVRSEDQLWIIHSTESTLNTKQSPHMYQNVFNWTSFVRQDSDVPSQYGRAVLQKNLKPGQAVRFMNKSIPCYPDWSEEDHFAAWMVSNCKTKSGREEYARKLQEYVKLDVYGDCGHKCKDNTCWSEVQNHMFYLAFENSVCLGYVTEKFWRWGLEWGRIPVALGDRAAYHQVAPPGSYIHVDDFPMVKSLATFMKEVFHNQTLYQSFFKWREKYAIVNDYWCKLCTKLHEWNGTRQVYSDFGGWIRQDTCKVWSEGIPL